MSVGTWQMMIKPGRVGVRYTDPLLREGVLVIEPLERGFGTTIGNALRRVLLSSIRGAAIVAVKIEGVSHEFSTVPGMVEDVPEMILNLKSLRVRYHGTQVKKFKLCVKGPKVVKASDIESSFDLEILDPDHVICTIDGQMELTMWIFIGTGSGYVQAADHVEFANKIGMIAVDSIFGVVKLVDFKVEQTRVGQRTDYDKLIMKVVTDGSMKPEDALAQAGAILRDHFAVFVNFDERVVVEVRAESNESRIDENLFKRVDEMELSVRSANCLKNESIFYIGDLVQRTEADMLRTPNFGRKSLNEIKELLVNMGLSFGMSVDGWPPENLEEKAKKLEERRSV